MRHRLGGVHCQTYEELFDILDSPHAPPPPALDIQALLLQQQLHQSTTQPQHSYFFDQQHQIQAEEDELSATLQAESAKDGFRSNSIVLICDKLWRVRQALLEKEFVETLYCSIYAQKAPQKAPIRVEVASNIATVSLQDQNLFPQSAHKSLLSLPSCPNSQVGGCQSKLSKASRCCGGCIWENLQLVIYYNKVEYELRQECALQPSSTYQHKIWLLKHQTQYAPLLAVYLRKANYIFTANFTHQPNPDIQLARLRLQQVWPNQKEGQVGLEPRSFREVLGQVQNEIGQQKRRSGV